MVALHGDADDVAPLALSESYCAATGQRLVVLAGTDHFAWIDPQSTAWPHELAAIASLTPPPLTRRLPGSARESGTVGGLAEA